MLDWLKAPEDDDHENSDIMSDAPRAHTASNFDAPDTPGPVFAYRALRSLIYGSEDRDDEEEVVVEEEKDNNSDKENGMSLFAQARTRSKEIASSARRRSPLRKELRLVSRPSHDGGAARDGDGGARQHDQATHNPAAKHSTSPARCSHAEKPGSARNVRSTPPRSRRPPPSSTSSPGKSILRTPGLPTTPRRQNIAVQFESVSARRGTLSLERESMVQQQCQRDKPAFEIYSDASPEPVSKWVDDKPRDLQRRSSKYGRDERLATHKTEQIQRDNQIDNQAKSTMYDTAQLDAYIAATESEMKKLVRYGQRMREYARLSQKHNAGLARQVEELKRLNQALSERRDGAGDEVDRERDLVVGATRSSRENLNDRKQQMDENSARLGRELEAEAMKSRGEKAGNNKRTIHNTAGNDDLFDLSPTPSLPLSASQSSSSSLSAQRSRHTGANRLQHAKAKAGTRLDTQRPNSAALTSVVGSVGGVRAQEDRQKGRTRSSDHRSKFKGGQDDPKDEEQAARRKRKEGIHNHNRNENDDRNQRPNFPFSPSPPPHSTAAAAAAVGTALSPREKVERKEQQRHPHHPIASSRATYTLAASSIDKATHVAPTTVTDTDHDDHHNHYHRGNDSNNSKNPAKTTTTKITKSDIPPDRLVVIRARLEAKNEERQKRQKRQRQGG